MIFFDEQGNIDYDHSWSFSFHSINVIGPMSLLYGPLIVDRCKRLFAFRVLTDEPDAYNQCARIFEPFKNTRVLFRRRRSGSTCHRVAITPNDTVGPTS